MINPEWYSAGRIRFAYDAYAFKEINVGPPPKEQLARLDYCDCCGNEYALRDLEWTGKQMLCAKCKK